jgi:Leucine-rich repeat (LRR) protein
MLYDTVVDLNSPVLTTENPEEISLINATDSNINDFKVPDSVRELEVQGSLTTYEVPDHIESMCCTGLGLQTIKLNENLQFLICSRNNLETIELPQGIISAWLDNNKLSSITAQEPLTSIENLDISYNNFKNFDLKLPNTMGNFFISGNPNIRIRHIDFVFNCDAYDNVTSLIHGDYQELLCNGRLLEEYIRHKVAQHSYTGQKYIDFSNW